MNIWIIIVALFALALVSLNLTHLLIFLGNYLCLYFEWKSKQDPRGRGKRKFKKDEMLEYKRLGEEIKHLPKRIPHGFYSILNPNYESGLKDLKIQKRELGQELFGGIKNRK